MTIQGRTSPRPGLARRVFRRARRYAVAPGLALLATALVIPTAQPALAFDTAQSTVVSEDPANRTPNVMDATGSVREFAQAGTSMVAGGNFSKVQEFNSSTVLTRNNLFKFNATTGVIDPNFAPVLDGLVYSVVVAPGGGSVFVGGEFKNLNGVKTVSLAKINLANGQRDATFKVPALDGRIFSMKLVGNRLIIAGSFTKIGANAIPALGAVNATTGAIEKTFNAGFAGTHRGAGFTMIRKMDVSPDGTRLAAVGNFSTVGGLDRVQAVLLDLTGATPKVANWETDRYKDICSTSFQSYVHDVTFAPDGSYFAIGSTGAYKANTLCDTTARWETGASGNALQPTWVNYTGGDTVWSIAISGTAVYVGGHFRWQNNSFSADRPGQGAISRLGLAALDPLTGVPFNWNPTRTTGVGVFDLYATDTGLWVGHDTNYIGRENHFKLAFFPLAGGTSVPKVSPGGLPTDLLQLGQSGSASGNPALFRVNAGGPAISATDGGIPWDVDTDASQSPYHTSGTVAESWSSLSSVNSSVPSSAPKALFTDDRADNTDDGNNMTWSFPVAAGTPVEVRLYFANQDLSTRSSGQREFDVLVDGKYMLWGQRWTSYDIVKDAGHRVGTMKSYSVTSDGSVDVAFAHSVNHPIVSAVEVIRTCGSQATTSSNDVARSRAFDGATVGASTTVPTTGTAWSQTRGAFMLSGKVYTGWADGHLCAATYDGTSFGPMQPINLGPAGNNNTLAGELPTITAMFFQANRIYYTKSSSTQLFYRTFTPESGNLSASTFLAGNSIANIDFSKVTGMFVSGGKFYFTDNTSSLKRLDWNGAFVVSGTLATVSGPGIDGVSWAQKGLALYVAPGTLPANQPPHAVIDSNCNELVCNFTSAGSGDPDGSIASYAWDFGDGTSSSQATPPAHTFPAKGTYTVSLTVTDNAGAHDTATRSITLVIPNRAPTASFTSNCTGLTCSFNATGSTDSDGSIASYAWNFGDGDSDTGVTPEDHLFPAEGTYNVSLTVTDNEGAPGSIAKNVSVVAPAANISFLGADTVNPAGNASSWTVHVPAGVAGGDGLVLIASNSSASTSAPGGLTGWTQVGQQVAGSHVTTVWKRVAQSGEAGAAVTVTTPAGQRGALSVLAYRGTNAGNPVSSSAFAKETVSRATHTTPTTTVPTDGSWVLSIWTDKVTSTTTTSMTPPAGETTRVSSMATGTGHVSVLVSDGAAAVGAGATAGGLTATADAASLSDTMWTLVLGR